jgi:hypothetical protein
MKRKNYLIEEENSTIALEISVNDRIEQGYEPIGGIGFDKLNGRYLQALYLPERAQTTPVEMHKSRLGIK